MFNFNKKIQFLILSLLILIFSCQNLSAKQLEINTAPNITVGEAFNTISSFIVQKNNTALDSELLFIGVPKNTPAYKSLQIFVAEGIIINKKYRLVLERDISALHFYKLAEKTFHTSFINAEDYTKLKNRKATLIDVKILKSKLHAEKTVIKKKNTFQIGSTKSPNSIKKEKIFADVYETLLKSHYKKNDFTGEKLWEGAIKGLAEGTGDKYTTYFPPTENKSFMENLDGEFEGIGSYVEMEQPGILKIVSPISGSPSEKAGLKGGDRITHVDDKLVTLKNSLAEVITWIKGPKGTTVVLTIKRGKQVKKITVTRDTIIIKNVDHKKLSHGIYYIKIITFGDNVSAEFRDALLEFKKQKNIKKIIIDLRNNPGGYLGEVSDMLSYFVQKGDNTVIVKYLKGEKKYKSKGYQLIDASKYNIVILQNEGSASAAEIMAGTLKDYYPKSTIIGKKSYGKGSVQSIKPYSDGSSLKYTIAKWFTGKTITGIDGVGIPVDIELEFDFEKYQKSKIDNQLEKAKSIR